MKNRTFQDVFKELRLEKKLSQERIATDLDVSQPLIAKWENNNSTPAPEMLEYIADYFKVSVDYLIGRTSNKYFQKENVYVTTIYDSGESTIELKSDKPFDQLSEKEKSNIIQQAMDELYEFKRELKKEKNGSTKNKEEL